MSTCKTGKVGFFKNLSSTKASLNNTNGIDKRGLTPSSDTNEFLQSNHIDVKGFIKSNIQANLFQNISKNHDDNEIKGVVLDENIRFKKKFGEIKTLDDKQDKQSKLHLASEDLKTVTDDIVVQQMKKINKIRESDKIRTDPESFKRVDKF